MGAPRVFINVTVESLLMFKHRGNITGSEPLKLQACCSLFIQTSYSVDLNNTGPQQVLISFISLNAIISS